ncbi:MAG: hypothetical protein AB1705_07520 [Verrucomicrobiota bacterium]
MSDEASWWTKQPLTFGSVAGFARAPLGRLLAVEFVVASLAAAIVVWFLGSVWAPLIEEAIGRLPDRGAIHDGRLEWPGGNPAWLVQSRFLSIVVSTGGDQPVGQAADFQLVLAPAEWRLESLFGYWPFPYPEGWAIALNRPELQPLWGAWKPMLLAGVAIATVLGLFLSWFLLAVIYAAPVKLMSFYADRDLTWRQSRRLATAALMPGALFLTLAILLYGLSRLPLAGLLLAVVMHLVIGWVYVFASPLRLPKEDKPKNPFATDGKPPVKKENPFAG